MSGHTPGPWQMTDSTSRFTAGRVYDITSEDEFICEVVDIANAHLIAAAPDLLAALKSMIDPDDCAGSHEWQAALAAIAKAEGTNP